MVRVKNPKLTAFLAVILALDGSLSAQRAGLLTGLDVLRPGRSRRTSSADADWWNGNADSRPIAPGETLTICELPGPGKITHLWFTVAAEDPHYGRSVTLRIYWDGRSEPGVEAPLGDFFAVGHGLRAPVDSLPVQVSSDGRAYNCFWPMPFRRSARITVSNDSDKYRVHALYWYVDWIELPSLPEDTPYFHAQYRQEFPCTAGRDYLICDIQGKGHYVGTVLSVQLNVASWFGEGDDRFFIDGEKEPSLRGTGTEDYFCDAWGFRRFNRPLYGVTVWEGFDIDDHGSAYRWHIADPVVFRKSLRVTIEHKGVVFHPLEVRSRKPLPIIAFSRKSGGALPAGGPDTVYVYNFDGTVVKSGFGERPDNFSSVAFWYQVGPAKRFASLPPASERLVLGTSVEAEKLLDQVKGAAGGLQVQKGGRWSSGAQLWYRPPSQVREPACELPLSVPHAGRYVLNAYMTRSWDSGTWAVYLDGAEVAKAVDLYAPSVEVQKVKLGVHTLTGGTHAVRFVYLRSNPQSRLRETGEVGRYLGVDRFTFRALPARSVRLEREKKK